MRPLILAVLLFVSVPVHAADAALMVRILECESGGRYNAVGDDGVSVGIAQFQRATFEEFKHLARMPRLRWRNPVDQMRLMVWMLDHGYGDRWTCYRRLVRREPMDADHGR